MNAYEYLQKLREALSILPDDEIAQAMRYYEDYFLDAGDENAAQVIAELGSPEQVAQSILKEYTGMTRRRPEHFDDTKQEPLDGIPLDENGRPIPRKPRKKGINPWVLLAIVLVGLPIGLPIRCFIRYWHCDFGGSIRHWCRTACHSHYTPLWFMCRRRFALSVLFLPVGTAIFCACHTRRGIRLCRNRIPAHAAGHQAVGHVRSPAVRALVSGLRWLLIKIRDMIRGVLQ